MTLKELETKLRPISWMDKLRATLFTSPSHNYDEYYSQQLEAFLDTGVTVKETTRFDMELVNSEGKVLSLWVSNYPYSYGNKSFGKCNYGTPSWKVILRLRELQLSKRDEVIEKYKKENTL